MTDFESDSLRERGRILDGLFAHYCNDWDGMTVDETCQEISSCNCRVHIACDNIEDFCCYLHVPEEVKQNARDYYDALDPFSEMDSGKRADILYGKPHPFAECLNFANTPEYGEPCKTCVEYACESVGAMAVSS